MTSSRIAPIDRTRPRHDEVIVYVDRLILDLKLQALGQEPNTPIDMTRLNEWHRLRRELEECRERLVWY